MPDTNLMADGPLTRGPDRALGQERIPAWRRLLAEPLVHFLALGGVLFALSTALTPPADGGKVIAVTAEVRREITDLYRATHGRLPTAAEFAPLVDNWVRTQVLYREALALGLDRGDEMIRERITHKMNLLVFSQVSVPPPTEAGLRAWFEANRARYDQPTRYDFFGLLLEGNSGEAGRAGAEAAARQLDGEEGEPPAELVSQVRVFANRDRAGVAALFGPGFADALAGSPLETWRAFPAEVNGQAGWVAVRLARVQEGRRAEFEQVRAAVEDAWRADMTRRLANDAVSKLAAGYAIQRDSP